MMDLHASFRTNANFSNISKTSKHDNQPLMFSARPKLEQLPFLNNLKMARKLLVALKNQKLRKSLYVVNEGSQMREKEDDDPLRHEKAKLSVMDLISEEGKFQELSNTIQSNLNKQSQSISPIMMQKKSSLKQVLHEFNINEGANQPLKGKQQDVTNKTESKNQPSQKPTILTRKNQLASQLNKIGHELEQTYFEVEELQKIFSILCNFYADNRKVVDKNLQLKEQKDLLKEQLQQFQAKIMKNQQKQIQLKDQQDDFIDASRQITKQYLKQLIPYNRETLQLCNQVQKISNQNLNFPIQEKDQALTSFSQPQNKHEQKHFQINLKFKQLKSQLEKIKLEKKNTTQNKNAQKKNKNQSQQNNTFNKLYVSEIYSL